MGVLILVLIAIGVFLSPDLRSNPIAVVLAVLVLLGAGGLVYGQWLDVRSKQAMIGLDRRDKERDQKP